MTIKIGGYGPNGCTCSITPISACPEHGSGMAPVVSETPAPALTEAKPPRIWVLHCPFRKTGSPVIGNMGSSIEPVIIMKMATWNRLCAEVPALQTMQFEVGAVDG